ncbi:MAG TPA: hypothetical protein VE863_20660, partial [Pyrinomonadaceae bacterium]|nr:hypothetical protein [Pyrinomonadaceae bacterium]
TLTVSSEKQLGDLRRLGQALRRWRRCHGFIATRTVMTTPTWFLIEPLFLPRDTIPTNIMQSIIVSDRFDYVWRLAIATFAAMNAVMLSRNHGAPILTCVDCQTGALSHPFKTPR